MTKSLSYRLAHAVSGTQLVKLYKEVDVLEEEKVGYQDRITAILSAYDKLENSIVGLEVENDELKVRLNNQKKVMATSAKR